MSLKARREPMGLPFLTWGWGSPARVQEGCEQDLWAQEASGSPLNLDVHTPTHLQLPWNKKDMKAEIQNIRSVSTGGLSWAEETSNSFVFKRLLLGRYLQRHLGST